MITVSISGLINVENLQTTLAIIWTTLICFPHPPLLLSLCHRFSLSAMVHSNPNPCSLSEIMQKLQHAELIKEEEDFLLITDEDLEASLEKN